MHFIKTAVLITILIGVKSTIAQDAIKLLSWNVYMLPSKTLSMHCNMKRARKITEEFLKSDCDVICVQELFDNKVRKYFCKKLKDKYPYQVGYEDCSGWIRTNSGLFIFSRYPAVKCAEIKFSECDISDCFADKGAIVVDVNTGANKVTIINTHLQAGRDSSQESIRTSQINEIAEMKDSLNFDTQLLYVGDFNISKSKYVNQMYQALQVCPVISSQSTHSHPSKDYVKKDSEKVFLDYAMRYERVVFTITTKVVDNESDWRSLSKRRKSLSDHRALYTVLRFL